MKLDRNYVIDCHADTLLKRYFGKILPFLFREQKFHVSKELLLQGEVDIQVFAIFVPPKLEKLGIEVTLDMIALAKQMKKDDFVLIESKTDFNKIKKADESLGMILSMEGAVALERNLELLPLFYELGVRNIGLAWSRKNLFCEGVSFSQTNASGEGLSNHGKDLVEQMETLGMVVDVSHLNRKGYADVVKISGQPFIASHSNAFQLCQVSRNLTDDQLMELGSAEGVVGITFAPGFLTQKTNASINDVIQHIQYITALIGINHVGIGSDFDGIGSTPKGLEDVSKMKDIPPKLETEGFSKQDIAKIMGGNFQRVFNKVWK